MPTTTCSNSMSSQTMNQQTNRPMRNSMLIPRLTSHQSCQMLTMLSNLTMLNPMTSGRRFCRSRHL